jgi:hypothetical protein
LPPEIVYGIDEFQKKQNLSFRTDALIEIVRVACSALGIDISNIPAAPASPVENQSNEEDEVPRMWKCPFTDRVAGYERCEERSKEHREECKACKAIPKYYWEILFPEEEVEEEEAEEAQKPISTIVPPQPQEPSVIEESMKDPDIELQQAISIKTLHDKLQKRARGQQRLGDESP